jgi:hypothetical protein
MKKMNHACTHAIEIADLDLVRMKENKNSLFKNRKIWK